MIGKSIGPYQILAELGNTVVLDADVAAEGVAGSGDRAAANDQIMHVPTLLRFYL